MPLALTLPPVLPTQELAERCQHGMSKVQGMDKTWRHPTYEAMEVELSQRSRPMVRSNMQPMRESSEAQGIRNLEKKLAINSPCPTPGISVEFSKEDKHEKNASLLPQTAIGLY